jgi:hypothetical protein
VAVMSWTPNEKTRAWDRERKRRAYVHKSDRGIRHQRAIELLARANELLGCKLPEIAVRRTELMAEISAFLSGVGAP